MKTKTKKKIVNAAFQTVDLIQAGATGYACGVIGKVVKTSVNLSPVGKVVFEVGTYTLGIGAAYATEDRLDDWRNKIIAHINEKEELKELIEEIEEEKVELEVVK